jgi:hypothetical protein
MGGDRNGFNQHELPVGKVRFRLGSGRGQLARQDRGWSEITLVEPKKQDTMQDAEAVTRKWLPRLLQACRNRPPVAGLSIIPAVAG